MTDKQIYKATLCFSTRRILLELFGFIFWIGLSVLGFVIADRMLEQGLIGLAIGVVVGLIILVIFLRWVSFKYKAGQIAMMTKGITEGQLPDDVIGEGKKIIKERFKTVAAFFALTGIIKGIFNQIGRGITAAGKALGGDKGETIGSVISTVIQVIIGYLCDCCLGWVFYRKEVKTTKATLEGSVLFFKHGKTLLKNMGRVFGIGISTMIAIGGAFGTGFYFLFRQFPVAFETVMTEINKLAENGDLELPTWLDDANVLMIVAAAIAGIIIWSFIHGVFIRPYVLVGVLRNYIQSGMENIPSESSFAELDSKSSKFKKLREKAA